MKNKLCTALIAALVFTATYALSEDRPVVHRSQPSYPEIAKRMSVTGEVRVQVTVGPDGKVQEAKVLSGHPMLKDAAASAAKNYVYQAGAQSTETIEFKFSR